MVGVCACWKSLNKINMKNILLNNILVFLVLGSGLGIAFWTYLGNKKKVVNKLFSCFVVLIVLNIVFSYLFQSQNSEHLALLWARMIWVTASLLIPTFYFFSIQFPRKETSHPILEYTFVGLGILFATLSLFSQLLIKGLKQQEWGNEVVYGSGILLFYIALVGAIIVGLWMILGKYIQFSKDEKLKVKYFIFGIAIYLVSNIIIGVIAPYVFNNSEYTTLGDYSAIFFLAFTAYAIMKHQLFDIKVIATESIVILLSVGLLIEAVMSSSFSEGAIKVIIWILATWAGYALVRSVKQEIKQKEDIAKLAKELEHANEHLEELDKLKDNFMSMASHELNTPIAAISGYLSMILEEGMGGEIPEKARMYLDSVYKSSKRLAALVRDLLNVSRIESNRVHLIYVEAQMEELLDQAIMEVGSKVKEAGHELVFERPNQALPKTWIDRDRIMEVIVNLLGNAIKYTESSGKIVVRAIIAGNQIQVSVQDNGKGIPPEKKDRVFQKFTQVDVLKDEVKGTGLGMYISKNLVELHKGKIWFKSEGEGKGSIFYFTVPILKEKPYDPHENEGAVLQLK